MTKEITKKSDVPAWLGKGRRRIINMHETEIVTINKDKMEMTFHDLIPAGCVIVSIDPFSGNIEIEEPPLSISTL
jgi:hypothetical protein